MAQVIDLQVQGMRELEDAMGEFVHNFRVKDQQIPVKKAMVKATDAAASFCPPGDKAREIIAASYGRRSKEVNKRTDTVRWATHWIKFYRQGKKPLFIPITLNPYSEISQAGTAPSKDSPNYAAYDSARKKRTKKRGVGFLKYQQTRKSTAPTKRGSFSAIDTASEIKKMRKIGRRGFVFQAWKRLGKKAWRGAGVKPYKKLVKESAINKWTSFSEKKKYSSYSQTSHNKLTYMKKAYGDFEPAIMSTAAKFLRKETEERLERRAAKLQAKANRLT